MRLLSPRAARMHRNGLHEKLEFRDLQCTRVVSNMAVHAVTQYREALVNMNENKQTNKEKNSVFFYLALWLPSIREFEIPVVSGFV